MTGPTKIVIIGNGFGGIYTLKNLHKLFHHNKKEKNVEITLLGEKNYFLFTPLLHEVATGGINPSNIIEPVREILGCCLDRFYLGKADRIRTKDRVVEAGGLVIPYDYLILAPGATTNFYDISGAEEYSLPLKSIDDAIKIKNRVIRQVERAMHFTDQAERQRILKFVIVGGGPTGVELAAELRELVNDSFSPHFSHEKLKDASILLIQKMPDLVPQFDPKIRAKSLEVLQKKGVEVMLNTGVKEITPSTAILDDGTVILTETIIWVGGVKPTKLSFDEAPAQSPDGRLIVNEFLQTENYKNIFALGDSAFFKQDNIPLPALAQVAEKEAAHIARNISRLIEGMPPEKFIYRNTGSLLSLGQWMAVGKIWNIVFSGYFAWWLWRTVYLFKLISWRKRIRVAVDWTMDIFSPRDISEL